MDPRRNQPSNSSLTQGILTSSSASQDRPGSAHLISAIDPTAAAWIRTTAAVARTMGGASRQCASISPPTLRWPRVSAAGSAGLSIARRLGPAPLGDRWLFPRQVPAIRAGPSSLETGAPPAFSPRARSLRNVHTPPGHCSAGIPPGTFLRWRWDPCHHVRSASHSDCVTDGSGTLWHSVSKTRGDGSGTELPSVGARAWRRGADQGAASIQ
jgi:hypothetical protein